MKKQNAVEVRNIRKQFSYSRSNNNSLKRAITQSFKDKPKGKDTFYALDGISFDVKKGDFFGILGRNGSGKSTLLKIISEIYQPTSGTVEHDGKLVSFIELGVGFKPELTGRENVFLNAALLGFSKQETEDMYEDIVAFAELEKFMDQKLKNYSSGMKVRLAFSVAIRSRSDILILDEVLAVGDAAFKRKSNEYFMSLKDTDQTIILVTHSMANVEKFCNRAIVIEEGRVTFEGDPEGATKKYMELFDSKTKDDAVPESTGDIELKKVAIYQQQDVVESVQFRRDFSINLNLHSKHHYRDMSIGLHIFDSKKRRIMAVSSKGIGGIDMKKGVNSLTFDIQNILKDGGYYADIAIENSEGVLILKRRRVIRFKVEGRDDSRYSKHGLIYPQVDIYVDKEH